MTDNNVARCKKCFGVALEPDGYDHILWHQSEDKKDRAFRARVLKAEETIAQFADRINAAERTVAAIQADNDRMRTELDAAEAADMAAPLNVSDLDVPEDDEDDYSPGTFDGPGEEFQTDADGVPQLEVGYPAIDRPEEPLADAISNLYTPNRNIM